MSREQLAKDNGMTIEFVNWFFDNKKEGCGNAWFMMMAAMWEGWIGLEAKCAALAAENAGLKDFLHSRVDESICDKHIKTPATESFLAEVRAQGVDLFALMFAEEAIKSNNITTGWRAKASRAASEYAEALREDAAQLRQGTAL